MKVSQTVETELGTVVFKGEISGAELDYVVQTGLMTLLHLGALKSSVSTPEEDIPEGTQLQ